MKVIKEGHWEDKMQVRCPACEAILEITSEDIHWEKSSESIWGIHFYNCGYCNKKNYIRETSELTLGVSLNVKR